MKVKLFFKILPCVIASSLFMGCNKVNMEVVETLQVQESDVFTLNATYGTDETKVAFDDDGLGLTWQPGDCLYLVDVSGTNNTVTLVTSITEPSKTAAFRSTSSVLTGDYVVLYGQSTVKIDKSILMQPRYLISNQVMMCGALSVSDGQTSASITLSHVFAMLTFKFDNLPVLSSMSMGMAVTEDGVIEAGKGKVNGKGYVSGVKTYTKFNKFGWYDGYEAQSLIVPMDLSGKTVYFYIQGMDASGGYVTYEFVKSGKNLCAGVNYNLTFDFNKASSVCTLNKKSSSHYILSTPAHFRAAAYLDTDAYDYSIDEDVDFSGEVYFPLKAKCLYGNGHTLSNISVNLSECSYLGVVSEGAVQDLKVSNSIFIGTDYVGSIAGKENYSSSTTITSCSAEGVNVQGENYVGGLFGYLQAEVQDCIVKGTVSADNGDYVGGIAGYATKDINQCGFEGEVKGIEYVGGIVGRSDSDVLKSYVKGDVVGASFVGGVSGYASCINSYHIGNTKGTSSVGGISGVGYRTRNCYSYGAVSGNCGIAPSLNDRSTHLTSSSYITSTYSNDNCYCGPDKTFLSKLSVINSDEAYSTQVWKDIDAQCPLLQWQSDSLGGDVEVPGFGDEDW